MRGSAAGAGPDLELSATLQLCAVEGPNCQRIVTQGSRAPVARFAKSSFRKLRMTEAHLADVDSFTFANIALIIDIASEHW